MSIESILETIPWVDTAPTSGTITTSAGTPNIVGVLTVFNTDAAVGDILVWDDGTGKRAMGQILLVNNDLSITLVNNVVVTVAGANFTIIKIADQTVPFFRADNTVPRSPIITPGSTVPGLMGVNQQALLLTKIPIDEGILVKSIYVRLPYQYTLAESQLLINFQKYDSAGVLVAPVNEIGEISFFYNTVENVEIPVNKYVYPPAGVTGRWQLGVSVDNGLADLSVAYPVNDFEKAAVSQINGPDMLNGLLLPIFIGMRILHATTPLTI